MRDTIQKVTKEILNVVKHNSELSESDLELAIATRLQDNFCHIDEQGILIARNIKNKIEFADYSTVLPPELIVFRKMIN